MRTASSAARHSDTCRLPDTQRKITQSHIFPNSAHSNQESAFNERFRTMLQTSQLRRIAESSSNAGAACQRCEKRGATQPTNWRCCPNSQTRVLSVLSTYLQHERFCRLEKLLHYADNEVSISCQVLRCLGQRHSQTYMALLDSLPCANAGTPRAMFGVHKWEANTIPHPETPVQKCARSIQHVQLVETRTPAKAKQMLRPRINWEHPDPKLSRKLLPTIVGLKKSHVCISVMQQELQLYGWHDRICDCATQLRALVETQVLPLSEKKRESRTTLAEPFSIKHPPWCQQCQADVAQPKEQRKFCADACEDACSLPE